MKLLLAEIAIVFLAVLLLIGALVFGLHIKHSRAQRKPAPRPPLAVGTFVPVFATTPNIALDTRTGSLCYSFDATHDDAVDVIPLCSEVK